MNASLVLEDFFSRSRIPPIIQCLNSSSLWSSFGWSTIRNFPEGHALSIGTFKKAQSEFIYFPYAVKKMKNRRKLSKNCNIHGKYSKIF